uniref:Uncharacterized protein n=1 Tax=Strigamia maritima TaxID=126957 RepID=T1IXZ2_STRMM
MTVKNVENQMSEKRNESQRIQDFIVELETFKRELEDEQQKIIAASVKFGRYLSKNAIVPFNDVIGKYIDHLIAREKDNVAVTKNDELLKRLQAMQEMYVVEAEAFRKAMMQPDAEELSVVEFKKLLRTLNTLKHNGRQLEEACEQASRCEKRENVEWECFHYPKQCQSYGNIFASRFKEFGTSSISRLKRSRGRLSRCDDEIDEEVQHFDENLGNSCRKKGKLEDTSDGDVNSSVFGQGVNWLKQNFRSRDLLEFVQLNVRLVVTRY